MSLLGHHVVYRVPEEHHGETIKEGVTTLGSVHHHELREFAGIVSREHEDGSCDLHIFVPNKPGSMAVDKVAEGDEHGQFSLVKPHRRKKAEPAE